MSGASLSVSDHALTMNPTTNAGQRSAVRQQKQQSVVGSTMGLPRDVFSASGLVRLLDLIFPAFASAYLLALSGLAFPSHGNVSSSSRQIFQGSKLFQFYVVVSTTIGLFLPLAYVLGGFARGDDNPVRLATPHLFLLSFQILTENVISGISLFLPPVRALVPLIYTVRRIFVIVDWMNDVWLNKTLPSNAGVKVDPQF